MPGVSNFQLLMSFPFPSLSLSSFPSSLWPSELESQPSGAQESIFLKGSLGGYDEQWGVETTDLEDGDPQRLKEKLQNEAKQITKITVFTHFFQIAQGIVWRFPQWFWGKRYDSLSTKWDNGANRSPLGREPDPLLMNK